MRKYQDDKMLDTNESTNKSISFQQQFYQREHNSKSTQQGKESSKILVENNLFLNQSQEVTV